MHRSFVLAVAAMFLSAGWAMGQDVSPEKAKLHKRFEEMVTGTKWTGRFTVTGKDLGQLTDESYEILSAKKAEDEEMWLLKARVKYGSTDQVFPVPIEVLWAGDTPVLTMNKLAIPGLGTFSCRVVLDEGRYAGTWQHDAVGGHLFGTFAKADAESNGKAEGKSDQPGKK